MRKWQFLSSLGLCLLVIFLLSSCGGLTEDSDTGDSDYAIRVTGTAGLSFAGNYSVTTSDGQITSRSVSGETVNIVNMGVEFVVRGIIVSCTFQKTGKSPLNLPRLEPEPNYPVARKGELGTLKIEIIKGGKLIASSYTTALFGVVAVATP